MPVREGYAVGAFLRAGSALLIAALASAVLAGSQSPAVADIVADVRAAMAAGGLVQADKALDAYRALHGSTPETVDALLWLARGALQARLYDKSNKYAHEGYDLAVTLQRSNRTDALQKSIGTAVELLALVLVEQGARSDAVYLLQQQLESYRDTPAAAEIQSALHLLSLEGRPAPPLDGGMTLGPKLSAVPSSGPRLLFFWAHWCGECKAESPMIEKLLEKYRARGLTVVAPTERYGYVEGGRQAAPDRELRYIVHVRDTYYRFLKHESVPVTDVNQKTYGITSVPMHVLIDREGVIRLYRPGRITEEELEAAIVGVLR